MGSGKTQSECGRSQVVCLMRYGVSPVGYGIWHELMIALVVWW